MFLPVSGEWTATAWNTWAILDLILVSVDWGIGREGGGRRRKEGRRVGEREKKKGRKEREREGGDDLLTGDKRQQ